MDFHILVSSCWIMFPCKYRRGGQGGDWDSQNLVPSVLPQTTITISTKKRPKTFSTDRGEPHLSHTIKKLIFLKLKIY